eukprot:6174642-Pleurochrysis_carterae.AAC.2
MRDRRWGILDWVIGRKKLLGLAPFLLFRPSCAPFCRCIKSAGVTRVLASCARSLALRRLAARAAKQVRGISSSNVSAASARRDTRMRTHDSGGWLAIAPRFNDRAQGTSWAFRRASSRRLAWMRTVSVSFLVHATQQQCSMG